MAELRDLSAPGSAGDIPLRLYRGMGTKPGPLPVLVFYHGGGYVIGDLDTHDYVCRKIANVAQCCVIAVDYRLAPEHKFPAAIEDSAAALRWIVEEAQSLSIDPSLVAVGGDSAGGNLSLSLINRLRAAKEPLPGCAWLVSPWTDLTMSGATLATKDAVDPLIHKAYLEELADAYAPLPIDRRDPLISPLFGDLRGFPPMLIQVGSAETLIADATRLAEAAGVADVVVRLQIWPHMIHAWPVWNAALEDGRRALAAAGEFVRATMR
jgi:epsilon-lactone hydrolase